MAKQVSKITLVTIAGKRPRRQNRRLKRAIWKDPDIGTFIYNEYGRVPVEVNPHIGGWWQSSDWVPYRRMTWEECRVSPPVYKRDRPSFGVAGFLGFSPVTKRTKTVTI